MTGWEALFPPGPSGIEVIVNATGDTTGARDVVNVNAALSTYNVVKLARGQTFYVATPLVIPSNTTLDASGATIMHAAGTSTNMLNNAAVANVRRVLDAVTTATSATMTSATAAFVAGDVGKAITIQGAGTAGAPLTTVIDAVTNTTTVTLHVVAVTTVSGQYAAIGPRDSNITVIGGTWDRTLASAGTNSVNDHLLRFRHVDGLNITHTPLFASVNGKYAINPGDCTRVLVSDPDFTGFSSDGVHLNGPCQQVTVRNARSATMHDDLTSMTARDSTAAITDCAGDIQDVVIDTATFLANTGTSSCVKIIAGKTSDASANYNVRRIICRNISGPNSGAPPVFLGDSSGGAFDDFLFDGVRVLGAGGGGGCIIIHGGTTVDRIIARDLVPAAADSYAIDTDVSVTRLEIDGVTWTCTSNSNVVNVAAGTIDKLIVTNAQISLTGGGGLVRVNNAAIVNTCTLSNNTMAGAGQSAQTAAGGAIGQVNVNGLVATTCTYPLGVYNSTTTLVATNVYATGVTNWFLVQGAGNVTIQSVAGMQTDANVLANTAMTGAFQFGTYLRAAIAQAGTVTLDLVKGAWQTITMTTNAIMTIAAPIHPPPASQTTTLTIEVLNSSGGVMGAITWDGSFIFDLTQTWVNPASTKKRQATFVWNSVNWVCISISNADY